MTEEKEHEHLFEAEVQQVLDIVINSLYTDREVFIRELVSNASDALEKLKYVMHTERDVFDEGLPLEINISTDEGAKTITIADYGVGMTRDELVENLGTIAHSGSKKFAKAIADSPREGASLIGQFGVGFYSAFIAAEEVTVYTHSWREDGEHLIWRSDGRSGYDIDESSGQRRGTKVVVKLRPECVDFCREDVVKRTVESYSSFVPFPILLNGERVNKVEALWLKSKAEVSEKEYTDFYQFIAKAFDEPTYTMHFLADAPIAINTIVFVPGDHPERFGMGQMDAGVDLYCKNVLIEAGSEQLLPRWMRFLKGVIDSEDLPLNISRESMQDSALVTKIGDIVTKRFIKFLDSNAKANVEEYDQFYKKFGRFLKEGVATDDAHESAIAKLLRFESSMVDNSGLTGFHEYIDRAKDGQDEIYYLICRDRREAQASPYLEGLQARGLEVLFCYDPLDGYVIEKISDYESKRLTPINRAGLDLGDLSPTEQQGETLSESERASLCRFVADALGDRVETVSSSDARLLASPAMALIPNDAVSPHLRQMMNALDEGNVAPGPKVTLEINARHALIKQLSSAIETDPELARVISEQLLDNSLLAAGLLESSTDTVERIYDLMGRAMK
ncbi:MAG: molecular chaperone HtpG [Verrucomicrobiota bacterium]